MTNLSRSRARSPSSSTVLDRVISRPSGAMMRRGAPGYQPSQLKKKNEAREKEAGPISPS